MISYRQYIYKKVEFFSHLLSLLELYEECEIEEIKEDFSYIFSIIDKKHTKWDQLLFLEDSDLIEYARQKLEKIERKSRFDNQVDTLLANQETNYDKDLYKYAESFQSTRDDDRDLVNYLNILEKNIASLELLVTDKQNVKRELKTFIAHYKLRYNEKNAWLGKFSEMAVRSWYAVLNFTPHHHYDPLSSFIFVVEDDEPDFSDPHSHPFMVSSVINDPFGQSPSQKGILHEGATITFVPKLEELFPISYDNKLLLYNCSTSLSIHKCLDLENPTKKQRDEEERNTQNILNILINVLQDKKALWIQAVGNLGEYLNADGFFDPASEFDFLLQGKGQDILEYIIMAGSYDIIEREFTSNKAGIFKDHFVTVPLTHSPQVLQNGDIHINASLESTSSIAAPVITAVIARLHSEFPHLSAPALKECILEGARRNFKNYDPEIYGRGILDVHSAREIAIKMSNQ